MESLRDIDPAAFARYMRAKHGEPCGEADSARLLAAAPDLLAALQAIVCHEQGIQQYRLEQARAAIARATGVV